MASNLPISSKRPSPLTMSAKQARDEVTAEARRIAAETKEVARTLTPTAMSVTAEAMQAIVDTIERSVDSMCKAETGMTVAEVRYRLDEGIQLLKRYKELGCSAKEAVIAAKAEAAQAEVRPNAAKGTKDEVRAELSSQLREKRAKVKTELTSYLEALGDKVYSAFCLLEARSVVADVRTVCAQLQSAGSAVVREVTENIANVRKFFPSKEKVNETTASSEGLDEAIARVGDDGTAAAMLGELSKSSRNERGTEDLAARPLDKKKLTDTALKVVSLLDSLTPLLMAFYTLSYNYETNKRGLVEDGYVHSENQLAEIADVKGLTETVTAERVEKVVDISNTNVKKELRRKYYDRKLRLDAKAMEEGSGNLGTRDIAGFGDLSIVSGTLQWNPEATQEADMDFMKFLSDQPDVDEQIIPEMVHPYSVGMEYSSMTDTVYLPPSGGPTPETQPSEIFRVDAAVAHWKGRCKFNPNIPLRNVSTSTDGGRLENMQHAGNNERELIEAVLSL